MSALTDLWNTIHGILTTSDWITLAIIAVIAILLAFFSEGLGSLITMVIGALIVFGIAIIARAAIQGGSKTDFGTLVQTDWHNAMALPLQTLLAYAIIFGVIIAVIGIIRTAIGR
jgi:hypothetical protein